MAHVPLAITVLPAQPRQHKLNAAATNTIARQLPEAKQASHPATIQPAEQPQPEQDNQYAQ